MKTFAIFMIFITGLFYSNLLIECHPNFKKLDHQVKPNKSITSIVNNSKYSLDIISYKDSISRSKKSSIHCVVKQKLMFKLNGKTIVTKLTPINNKTNDKKFLKYVINEVAVDTFNNVRIYFLNLYSSNGEAEYNYVYNCNGVLLFYQKCNKNGCDVVPLKVKKEIASNYFNNTSSILNFIEIKDICF